MIDVSPVIARFLLLCDRQQSDEKIQSLCQSSAQKISSLIKEDADESDDRLINAAACDAFYQWILLNRAVDSDALKSFRAGDITVENDADAVTSAAYNLKKEAFEALDGLIRDKGFYFSEVDINDAEISF
mgnify:CR=1 FL=1